MSKNVNSQDQRGGITAETVNINGEVNIAGSNKKKMTLFPYIVGLCTIIGVAVAVLTYLGLKPKEAKMDRNQNEKKIINVTSHNQQGGITAGEVNIGAQPRDIQPDAAKLLIDQLVKVPAEKIELRCLMNDAETQNFSFLLKDIFNKANWPVVKELQVLPNKPIKNIVMGVPEQKKDGMAALILWNWFEQNGFKPTAELVKDHEEIIILIGSKN